MKSTLTTLATGLVLAFAAPAFAQTLAIVNGKPVPSSRVDVLLEQVARSGRPVDDALKAQVKEEIIARLLSGALWAGLGLPASTPLPSLAADLHYRGLIELDYGSSLSGIPRHSRYFVDFILNGDALDTNHLVIENSLINQVGQKGLTTFGNVM